MKYTFPSKYDCRCILNPDTKEYEWVKESELDDFRNRFKDLSMVTTYECPECRLLCEIIEDMALRIEALEIDIRSISYRD